LVAGQWIRARAKLPNEQLSIRADLSRPYIRKLERNITSPTVEALFRICDALDVSAVTIIKKVDAARKRNSSP
jgi:transcriptional regulator with XRE-family HTH domain